MSINEMYQKIPQELRNAAIEIPNGRGDTTAFFNWEHVEIHITRDYLPVDCEKNDLRDPCRYCDQDLDVMTTIRLIPLVGGTGAWR